MAATRLQAVAHVPDRGVGAGFGAGSVALDTACVSFGAAFRRGDEVVGAANKTRHGAMDCSGPRALTASGCPPPGRARRRGLSARK
jgi:hypothetical protein